MSEGDGQPLPLGNTIPSPNTKTLGVVPLVWSAVVSSLHDASLGG
jgi:hypothetical protein